MSESLQGRERVEKLAEEFVQRYRRGERPSVSEYATLHPEYADQVRELFPALILMEELGPDEESVPQPPPAPQTAPLLRVGGYRVLREIGRGGMGVVYEAEQESLGRRVALKVLPVQSAADPRVLARFHRESRAAANLHHTNIVPVFEVGQEGEVCYFAMQLIQGQALDQVLKELQRLGSGEVVNSATGAVAHSLLTGVFAEPGHEAVPEPCQSPAASDTESLAVATAAHAVLPGQAELSGVQSNYGLYCRNVARIGLQTAEALAHAHARGIIHRDIKPSNLLLDTAGVVWVSDFGLAQTEDGGLTEPGEIVGTLRYIPPERFQGECDARSDVYSLGLTLYELLTLRPPFDGSDRLRLIEQITRQEPVRPRVRERRIPRDLETVVLKAMDKDPARRYPSADDLAADLSRFLADEPLRVRPVGAAERLWRWCRRNPALAIGWGLFVLALLVGQGGATYHWWRANEERHQANEERHQANEERKRADEARGEAESQAAESRRRLVRQYVTNGERLAAEGDVGAALAWLAEALDLDRGEPEREWSHRVALHSLLRRSPQLLDLWALPEAVHRGSVASPDARRVLAVNAAGLACVWDIDTRHPLPTPPEQAGAVRFAAFGPDGRLVLTANTEHTARVWEVETGHPVTEALAVGKPIGAACLTRDGRRVVTLSDDRQARLWDGKRGQALLAFADGAGTVRAVALSPDGQLALTVGEDNRIRLWDADTGKPRLEPLLHPFPVLQAAFSPDGKRVVAAGNEFGKGGQTLVWSCDTGELLQSAPAAHGIAVSFSPDGTRGLTISGPVVRLGRSPADRNAVQLPHRSWTVRADFSPDSSLLVTTGADMTAYLWDAAGQPAADVKANPPLTPPIWRVGSPGNPILHVGFPDARRWRAVSQQDVVWTWAATATAGPTRMMKHARAMRVALRPDGRRAVTASGDGTLRLWDVETGTGLETAPMAHATAVTRVVFSPDGGLIAACADGAARLWHAQTGAPVGPELKLARGDGRAEAWAAFSRDGRYLVTTGGGREAGVWEVPGGRMVTPPLMHAGPVTRADISPDGRRVVTGSGGGSFVWDLATGERLFELAREHNGGYLVAYSPDGRRIVTANLDGTARVWDADTGTPVTPPLSAGYLFALAFSPDGGRLVTGGWDNVAQVWDAQTGKPVTRPLRHGGLVGDASFSADGRFIITASPEGDRVWDAGIKAASPAGGGRLLTIPILPARSTGFGKVVLTPDNRRLVSADHDGWVRIWEDVVTAGDETAEELVLRARLVAGHRVDADGLVPLEPAALLDGWETLRARRKEAAQE